MIAPASAGSGNGASPPPPLLLLLLLVAGVDGFFHKPSLRTGFLYGVDLASLQPVISCTSRLCVVPKSHNLMRLCGHSSSGSTWLSGAR